MSKVVGIDLGTTNSLVAYVKDGVPTVIRDARGDALVPSIVSVGPDGTVFVGREAQRRLLTDARRTVYSVKRFMGKGIDDVQGEATLLPFGVSGEAGGVVRIGLAEREFTPPEISAFVLRELKRRAEEHFAAAGEIDPEVDRAVITVPAYFNDAQRTATRDAGRIAGLEVLRIINEPTAASLAYGLDKKNHGIIAVYDFGGGTFDISILRVEEGVFQVLATNGDTHLGGDDVDMLLVERILADLDSATPRFSLGSDLVSDAASGAARSPELIQQIRKAVIQAKWDLSDADETTLLGARITRAEFDEMIRPVIDRTLEPCRQALEDAGLQPSEVDEVVLVGGSTRIPLVRRLVGGLFGRTPHSELNPDEVVALGAAVQADILVTGNREMLLLDVTPLSLGIETMGGVVSKIILRNSTIPATGSEMFTTGVDNQTAVDIHVLQGERELVADNRSLARFRLRGIPPMPAGIPRVQVQFQIDANGILSVTASELRTDVEQTIEVKPSYGLTDDQVEQMLIDSFEHAEADFAARLLIEARNEAESVILATEKTLRSPEFPAVAAEALKEGEQRRIEQALAGLKHVNKSEDRDAILQWTKVLNDVTQHLAEVMMNRSVQAALAGKNIDRL
jgi:Fe-S protein assembly chaperone HscA